MRSAAVIALLVMCGVVFSLAMRSLMGDGALKRTFTMSGIYSICKPDGYEVVCFLDADGKEGGMFCLPLSQVGGNCKG